MTQSKIKKIADDELTKQFQGLGDRMKIYEKTSLSVERIPSYQSFIIRLDGNNFSKFTSGLIKPFDKFFVETMIKTANDLLSKFNAVTVYTHSDEITMIFKGMMTLHEHDLARIKNLTIKSHLHNGKVFKLLTLTASYATARFNYHYSNVIRENRDRYPEEVKTKILSGTATFDARLLLFPIDIEKIETANHMIWRSIYDCFRNSVSTFCDHHLGKKAIFGLTTEERLDKLKSEKNIIYENEVPEYYRHGVYCKKMLVDHTTTFFHKKKKIEETVTHKKGVIKNFTMKCGSSEFYQNLLFSKYYDVINSTSDLNVNEIVDYKF